MQLFIIHFLILPIKKFKKQKLKIIFFNFLNKCNRYNIYCVSYYKGNLGKESCTYMKAYKKIISFILTLVMMLLELKNKDERALKICMNKYYRYVVYIVENIIGSALPYEDKEEVVSNVFVALWNYSADLDTDNYSTFKPYLGTIARNMAKNALRKTSKMHFENYEDAFQVGTNEHIEYGPLKEEVIKCLKESIYELSVDERKCFISYYYYTKTIAVIAEETGLKESTVKSKLLRGRKKLKLKMEKKGFRYEDCKIFFE